MQEEQMGGGEGAQEALLTYKLGSAVINVGNR